ncbi:MAG: HAMP domain-containing histidine kinase [Ruminococcaceae bacterium]|nr:HAMP domain-containing histidine kinase [Oscillospiraceae bacterium]
MRNREIALYLLVSVLISAAVAVPGFVLGGLCAGLLCLLLAALLIGWGLGFTLWRYRKIKTLSAALAASAAGGTVLDLRTNREGELSILQNDLYKVTSALAGQADHLRQDKLYLTNALSDISHQLKTPLTSLMVNSDLLQAGNLPDDKRREFLARITSQLERLRWLVNALLRFSRLDAEVVAFRREPVPLHGLLSRAVEPLLPLAEQKDIAIRIECERGLSWQGDAEWTAEAVGNLAKNCIEHTPPGGTVRLACADNPLHTQIVVEDTGPGFSETDLPRLFERYYRGENAGSDGVGIGLSMAKAILQAQRADVAAENIPGGGARFVVKLYKSSTV